MSEIKWTMEACIEKALKYTNLTAFLNNSEYCYKVCKKNGWFEEATKHITKCKRKPFWNKERCTIEALKYNLKSDFYNAPNGAYNSAWKNNWLDEICEHMEILGNKYKRFIYAYEFSDNCVYIGLTFSIKERQLKHKKEGSVFEHVEKTGITPVFKQLTSEPIDVEQAIILEGDFLKEYKANNWTTLNKMKTGGIGGNNLKWTFEAVKEEALKYNLRKKFSNGNSSAYGAAWVHGWLDDVCSHMETFGENYTGKYTLERCIELSKNCTTSGEFKRKYPAHYQVIFKRGWKKEVFKDLIFRDRRGYYTKEKCMELSTSYSSKSDLYKGDRTLSATLYKNKWMDEAEKLFKKI